MTPRFCSATIIVLLPPASAIASVPVIPPESQSSALASASVAVPLGLSALLLGGFINPGSIMSTPPICNSTQNSSVPQTVKLSLSFVPLPTKLVLKIQLGQSVEMKELLTDNIALQRQLDDIQPELHPVYTLPGTAHPHLREISTPLEWIYSFLASLLALTVLSLRGNQGLFCSLCQEADHTESHYALAFFQVSGYLSDTQHRPSSRSYVNPTLPLCPTIPGATARRTVRPETLERICASWNKGRCAFPGSCTFKHVCATCHRCGHGAQECEEIPDSSPYKIKAAPLVAGQRPPEGPPSSSDM